MPVGSAIGSDQVNNIITSLAVQLRDIMQQIHNLDLSVNGQGTGLAYLISIGYSNAANPANPGSVSDAALALSTIGYLSTVAGVYYGTVQQGGTGGAGATLFPFDKQLSQVWAGRVAAS